MSQPTSVNLLRRLARLPQTDVDNHRPWIHCYTIIGSTWMTTVRWRVSLIVIACLIALGRPTAVAGEMRLVGVASPANKCQLAPHKLPPAERWFAIAGLAGDKQLTFAWSQSSDGVRLRHIEQFRATVLKGLGVFGNAHALAGNEVA
jgi:hypothetical protein